MSAINSSYANSLRPAEKTSSQIQNSKIIYIFKKAIDGLVYACKYTNLSFKKLHYFMIAGSLSDYLITMLRRHETIADLSADLCINDKLELLRNAIKIAYCMTQTSASSIYAADPIKLAKNTLHIDRLCYLLQDIDYSSQGAMSPKILHALTRLNPANRDIALNYLRNHQRCIQGQLGHLIASEISNRDIHELNSILETFRQLGASTQLTYRRAQTDDVNLFREICNLYLLPQADREQIILLLSDYIRDNFINTSSRKRTLLSQLIAVPSHQRHDILGVPIPAAQVRQNTIDVHSGVRDDTTLNAIRILYAQHPSLSKTTIDTAYLELIAYINTDAKNKDRALRALQQPRSPGASFGPLVSDTKFTLLGHEIAGKEFAARLWIFAKNIDDPKERDNAKYSIVKSLADSYDASGSLVCNQGKVQRLVVSVLQGRLEGVNIEGHDLGQISATDAINVFFSIPAHQTIDSLKDLLEAAETFCKENTRVIKESFMEQILQYAQVQGIL